jgi:GntR family transcriptional regulator, sialic acid-inducible nan operon repressor
MLEELAIIAEPRTAEGYGKSRAAEAIAGALIADIKSGHIAVGEALPSERDLCERFDSSRPTVREALVLMQQRGYANLGATRRPRAEKPSFEKIFLNAAGHIRDMVGDAESGAYLEQIRQFIEVGAVRSVAQSASAIKLAQIHSALNACHDAIGDLERFKEADQAFHRAIVSVVDNPIILTLHDMFVRTMLQQRGPTEDQRRHDMMVYEEHRQIYEAIVNGDAEKAVAVMCAETLWWRCHRRHIADVLMLRDHEVVHVLGPGDHQPHVFHPNARRDDQGWPVYDVSDAPTLF